MQGFARAAISKRPVALLPAALQSLRLTCFERHAAVSKDTSDDRKLSMRFGVCVQTFFLCVLFLNDKRFLVLFL
jgi:hypothetical protein